VALAALGVVLIFYHEVDVRGPLALAGSAAVVLAAAGTAWAGVMIKGRGGHIDPVTMTAVQMVAGFPPMLLIGIPLEGNPLGFAWTGRAVFSLLYLALMGSSVTFVLLYWLMQRVRVTRTMLIPFFSTLIAVGLGAVVLDERLSWRTAAGGAAILLGLASAVLIPPAAHPPVARPSPPG
jgi:drug/metabolite transporter (DMT)-like permease